MLEIRSIASQDWAGWLNLWIGYLDFYRTTLSDETTARTWHRLLAPGEEPHGLVALVDGAVCGIAHFLFHRSTWADACYCYLEDLYVAPDARGHGVGKALITAVFGCADDAGASRVYWNTEETNHAARKLYARLGTLTPFVQYRR